MHPRQNRQSGPLSGTAPNPLRLLPPKLRTAIVFPQQLRLAAVSPPQVQPQPSLSSAQPCGSGAWPGAVGACPDSGAGPVCVLGQGGGSQEAEVPAGRGEGASRASHLSALV